jgi:hypothetical protein
MISYSNRLQREFDRFDEENPEVWSLFCQFAQQAINAGRTQLSASLITERIRWETTVVTNGDFKINNNYRAYYARKFAAQFPQYADYFRFRQVRNEPSRQKLSRLKNAIKTQSTVINTFQH